jgi:hypothetical protein
MKIFHHHTHKHVEDKEPNKEQEGNEVQETPFIEIFLGLQ